MRAAACFYLSALCMAVCGCAQLEPFSMTANPDTSKPVIEASDAETRQVLRCLGRQVEAFMPVDQAPLLVAVGSFKNKSVSPVSAQNQDLPYGDVESIVEASLAQISPKVAYTDAVRLAADRRLVPWAIDNLNKPELFLDGAILIQEKTPSIENNSWDFGATFGVFDIRISSKKQTSEAAIELDMNATSSRKQSFYGSSAPLRISFQRTEGSQITLAGAVANIAIGGETISRRVNSYGQALRLGIAHQIVKLLGRYRGLPYWFCTQEEADTIVQTARLDLWHRLVAAQGDKVAGVLQELLAYNELPVERTDRMDTSTVAALSRFMASRGKVFDAGALEHVYWELLLGIAQASEAGISAGRLWSARWTHVKGGRG